MLDEDGTEYHLYFANLPRSEYAAPDIAQLYRVQWEVELLFKELKSRFRLDEINTTKPYIIEALILMAAISLITSREIVDDLYGLDAKRCEVADADSSASRLPPRRGSLVIERYAHLIQSYVMLDSGYELPDLDELLLWASRNLNPHRDRLRCKVESDEYAYDRH